MRISRRGFVTGVAGLGLSSAVAPHRARAADGPIRIGLLDGKDRTAGVRRHRHGARAGHVPEGPRQHAVGPQGRTYTADTAGVPATARTKAQELVEKNNVHCLIGPLAAFEALAIDDYLRQTQTPTLSVAAAEDMTQRHPNPWFVRATSTSSQCAHPLGEYAAKELKYKKMITIADDIAYGQEMVAGFQRVFEDNGGEIIQKLFPPLTVPDYGSLCRTAEECGCDLPGLCRVERFPFSPAIRGIRAEGQDAGDRRHDRARRGGAAQHGRRGARHRHHLLVLGRTGQQAEPDSSRRPSARSSPTIPVSTRRAPM